MTGWRLAWSMKLRSGAMHVGVRIWFGAPVEPWTGEELDRAPCWNAQINGRWADIQTVWPKCAAEPIDEAEYRYLARLQSWGEANAPTSPQANPTKKIDFLTAPVLF